MMKYSLIAKYFKYTHFGGFVLEFKEALFSSLNDYEYQLISTIPID